ncbi:ABC transporter permease [Duganella levis]|uniref:FtsX-like permease family protein n=1 Tax=Duganella levis TaxID=2692169 RepID=A0ABW9VXQ0_9BURK|nr:ABC transporter permease [Duganella levis]MYN26285.1 FtsX-like permease family protein [Duganella levis]
MLNLRDFRIGLRLLAGEPAYSAVVILGLAVGFSVCFLLLGFVRYVSSYDAQVPQAEQIYLVKYKYNGIPKPQWFELAPLPLLDVATRSGLVDQATALNYIKVDVKVGALLEPVEFATVHPSFEQIFDVRPLEGDLSKALLQPDMVALTRGMAHKLYGQEHVLGRTLQAGDKTLTVAAVLPDPPSNSTVTYSGLTGIETTLWPADERMMLFQSWSYIYAKIYVKLKPNASPLALSQILQAAADNSPLARDLHGHAADIRLGALPAMYFDRDTAGSPYGSLHGDIRVVYGLTCIALLIMLLATINYVNLATVRTLRRRREIALRKVLGASVGRIAQQFLAESLLVALGATGLGLLFAYLLLPIFADLVDRKLDDIFTPSMLALSLAAGAVVGVVSAIYPLWVAMRVRPPEAFAGRGDSETGDASALRRVLTVLQFAVAIGLTGATFAIAYQTRYALLSDPGFDSHRLLVMHLPASLSAQGASSLREALSQVPGVEGVAATDSPLGVSFLGRFYAISRDDGTRSSIVSRPVTANFFSVYGIQPLAGRLFDSHRNRDDATDTIVISAAALRPLNFATPQAAIGQIIRLGEGAGSLNATIVGVAPDIQLEGLHKAARPVIYATSKDITVLTVRTHGDVAALANLASGLARQYFPNDVVDIRHADSYFLQSYAEDIRLAKMLAISSAVAIAIAAFGMYVLAAYTVRRRQREIVIRKLHGASARIVAMLIAREFIVLSAAGTVLGLPVAWYASHRYLASFVTFAPMAMLPLAVALLLICAVMLGATLAQTLAVSRMNPALALRSA